MTIFVSIPEWKGYLYSLLKRVRIERAINSGKYKWGFTTKEIVILRKMNNTYAKEVLHKQKTFIYNRIIDVVLSPSGMSIAAPEEIEVAMKLLPIKTMNMEVLPMEINEVKGFAKEVGINPIQAAKFSMDELIIAVVKAVDPAKQYSAGFVKFYESLEDKYFDSGESIAAGGTATAVAASNATAGAGDFNELIAHITGCTKKADLVTVLNDADFKPMFPGIDADAYKGLTAVKGLKEAMVNAINAYVSGASTCTATASDAGLDDETKNALADAINGITNEEGLGAFLEDADIASIFSNLEIPDPINVDTIKTSMLKIIGFEPPPPAATKPMTLAEKLAAKKAGATATTTTTATSGSTGEFVVPFNPAKFDLEKVYAETEALGIPQLRKFVKQLGISGPPGSTKETLLGLVGEKLIAVSEGKETIQLPSAPAAAPVQETKPNEASVEVTPQMIEDAVKAADLDTLIAICEVLGLTPNGIQKRSAKLMGDLAMKSIPAATTAKPGRPKLGSPATVATATPTKESIYAVMERMVLEGADLDAIVAAVKDEYKTMGVNILKVKPRVKGLIEIIKADHSIQ